MLLALAGAWWLSSGIVSLNLPPSKREEWKLVWSDEFKKDGLPDPTKWNYELGKVRNNEAQDYTKRLENARVKGGELIIEGRHEAYQGSDYSSASLVTYQRFGFQYGRVEVVAKLPKAKGTWPAIWMMGTDVAKVGWPKCGEIDIMEHVLVTPDLIYGTVHQGDAQGKHVSSGDKISIPDYGDKFHLYALEWTKDKLDFYVDQTKYFTYRKTPGQPWSFDRPMYLLINLAIGGDWGSQAGMDPEAFPQKYEVKSVKVFQKTKRVFFGDSAF
jgi:beta-glucanase (GH16 family)